MLLVFIIDNNIRKATTEKSSLLESSRESGVWWKPLMRNVYENHSQAVMPKTSLLLSVTVCLR